MTSTSAFHPLRLDFHPNTAPSSPEGAGAPKVGVKAGYEAVPCSVHFDAFEARTYAGVAAADLVEHAKDIEAMQLERPLRHGSSARFQERVSEFTDGVLNTALHAYIKVKNALRLMVRPLQNRVRRRQSCSRDTQKPTAPKIWVTKAPSQAQWTARDIEAGYDIRGTSPTWVMRRAYRHRNRRRLELEPFHETAYRLGQKAQISARNTVHFIGPPRPLHYQDVEDLHQIWPPIVLPKGPEGRLPRFEDLASETEDMYVDEALTLHIDTLIEGYNYALEQFGEDAAFNYLRGLSDKDAAHMDKILNQFGAPPKNKEPP